MTITTLDGLVSALGNNNSRLIVEKAAITNQVAGPSVFALAGNGHAGAGRYSWHHARALRYGAYRLAFLHRADLARDKLFLGIPGRFDRTGRSTWSFTTASRTWAGLFSTPPRRKVINAGSGIDLDSLSIPAARRGASGYTDVRWFLEVYHGRRRNGFQCYDQRDLHRQLTAPTSRFRPWAARSALGHDVPARAAYSGRRPREGHPAHQYGHPLGLDHDGRETSASLRFVRSGHCRCSLQTALSSSIGRRAEILKSRTTHV
jgi:hypothetical protein